MTAPPDWPAVSRDEAERLIRRVCAVLSAGLGELEVGQELAGGRFDWQTPQAQAWILDHIRGRLFPGLATTGSLTSPANPQQVAP